MSSEKLMETIRAVVVPTKYNIYPHELVAIIETNDGEIYNTAFDAFCYGSLKGQRAERAAAKKKAQEKCRKETEKHAPGYGLLMALIEKNKSNERFIGMMTTQAKSLENISSEAEGESC